MTIAEKVATPKVKIIPISIIKPYWRNPRNNENAVDAVAQSIRSYGFNSPIIIDKDNVIIAGHTRYKAARKLGMDKVPAVQLTELPAEKVREYRIADNKTSEIATWDMHNLLPELRELIDINSMQTFFMDINLESLLVDPDKGMIPANNSQKKIDAAKERMDSKFDAVPQDFIETICPHCMESFNIDKAYVMAQLGITQE